MKISVVLPTYNEASWLPDTLQCLDVALQKPEATEAAEIIVVVDGSTDATVETLKALTLSTPLRIIEQENAGRFIAREKGVAAARYDTILFIDSRVHIHKDSITFVKKRLSEDSKKVIWNAHVTVAKAGNPYARFWDAITQIAWRRYFKNPREVAYGVEEFDYYPKGTTCFLVPKKLILKAMHQFDSKTKNSKASNDDTLMIKYLAAQTNINISPQFSCVYHSRSSLKKFLKHAYHRGRVFVDGFLRRDGNRYFLPLMLFLAITITIPILIIIMPALLLPLFVAAAALWVFELALTLLLGVSFYDAVVLFLLSPLFAVAYGLGIWSATVRRYL